jgi:AcrR family transcriptional regulator
LPYDWGGERALSASTNTAAASSGENAKRSRRDAGQRDAARSRRDILDAALLEFSEYGHGAARVDRIAAKAGVSKPLIYDYYGDKDALYTAALREAYVQIRSGEEALNLENKHPEDAIRELTSFTLNHYRANPWFISMLNTENLRRGASIGMISDLENLQSALVSKLRIILRHGAELGVFRDDVDPVDLYIMIASICYFPISNRHTLQVVFSMAIDDAWIERHGKDAQELVIRFLRPTDFLPADGSSKA